MSIISQDTNHCQCSEGKRWDGSPNFDRPRHSCAYVAKRNSLLDQAADFADSQLPPDRKGTRAWSRIFNMEIVRLLAQQEAADGGDHGQELPAA
jgi:hypothetical protein